MTKIKLTDDIELRQEIIEKLKENDGYCPCALTKTQDTVCMKTSVKMSNLAHATVDYM